MPTRARAAAGWVSAVFLAGSLGLADAQTGAADDDFAGWTAPRTPWGDPDISGDFTNKFEIGTPMERPPQYQGRWLDDFTPGEIAAIAQARQELVLLNYPHQFDPDNPAGNLGGPNTWGDRFDIYRGSRPWLIVDPADGQMPPLTDDARQRGVGALRDTTQPVSAGGAAASWEEWLARQGASLYDRCVSRGLPGSMMAASYGNSYQILQTPDHVAIRYEMVHETRIVPLDGRPHAPGTIRAYMGNARGHWEGDTLVIETRNLRTGYRGANPETLTITERFTRVAPDVVEWRVTMDDPATWTAPWTFSVPLTQDSSERIQEYACHAGNYSMPMRLRAARKAELEAEQAIREGRQVPLRQVLLDEDEQTIQRELRERRDQLLEITREN